LYPVSPGFGVNVWYALHDEDLALVRERESGNQELLDWQDARLVLRFRFWPDINVAGLLGGEVRIGTKSLVILERVQATTLVTDSTRLVSRPVLHCNLFLPVSAPGPVRIGRF